MDYIEWKDLFDQTKYSFAFNENKFLVFLVYYNFILKTEIICWNWIQKEFVIDEDEWNEIRKKKIK